MRPPRATAYPRVWRPVILVFQIMTEMTTRSMFLRIPVSVMTRPEVLPIYGGISVDESLQRHQTRSTYQENAGNVEHEGDDCIEEKHSVASLGQVLNHELGNLGGDSHDKVHDCTDRGVVVKTNKGIHLHPLGAQHDLNHDEPNGLEDGTGDLVQKTHHGKLDLASAGKTNAKDNNEDVKELVEAGVGDAPDPGAEKNGDGGRCLEHLDECDRQVEIDDIGADERARIAEADGHDSAQVEATRDGKGSAAIEESRESR